MGSLIQVNRLKNPDNDKAKRRGKPKLNGSFWLLFSFPPGQLDNEVPIRKPTFAPASPTGRFGSETGELAVVFVVRRKRAEFRSAEDQRSPMTFDR